MSINISVKILVRSSIIEKIKIFKFFNFKLHHRMDIEDNIGEGIHIHYKNMRFDFSVKDYVKFVQEIKNFK